MIPFSDEELLEPVNISIQKVRPILLQDKGDISIVKIENGKVFVRLLGACNGCAHSSNTLKFGVEKQLKNDIHQEIEVVQVQ